VRILGIAQIVRFGSDAGVARTRWIGGYAYRSPHAQWMARGVGRRSDRPDAGDGGHGRGRPAPGPAGRGDDPPDPGRDLGRPGAAGVAGRGGRRAGGLGRGAGGRRRPGPRGPGADARGRAAEGPAPRGVEPGIGPLGPGAGADRDDRRLGAGRPRRGGAHAVRRREPAGDAPAHRAGGRRPDPHRARGLGRPGGAARPRGLRRRVRAGGLDPGLPGLQRPPARVRRGRPAVLGRAAAGAGRSFGLGPAHASRDDRHERHDPARGAVRLPRADGRGLVRAGRAGDLGAGRRGRRHPVEPPVEVAAQPVPDDDLAARLLRRRRPPAPRGRPGRADRRRRGGRQPGPGPPPGLPRDGLGPIAGGRGVAVGALGRARGGVGGGGPPRSPAGLDHPGGPRGRRPRRGRRLGPGVDGRGPAGRASGPPASPDRLGGRGAPGRSGRGAARPRRAGRGPSPAAGRRRVGAGGRRGGRAVASSPGRSGPTPPNPSWWS
jgi:hypothetical protein